MRLRVTLEDKSLNLRIVYLFFKCKLSYVLHSRVGKNSKKRATATQGVTCFVKRVKSSYSIFHDTLKCHYHDSFTCSLLVNFFLLRLTVSIFIALLGVFASASPPFQSGLALVFIN